MVCDDYVRHEFLCQHRPRKYRWKAFDGCSALVCEECMSHVALWKDLLEVVVVDEDGIPIDSRHWTFADALLNAAREACRAQKVSGQKVGGTGIGEGEEVV